MNFRKTLFAALLLLAPLASRAQIQESEMDYGFGARISAEADKKLAKGLHLTLGGEVRSEESFADPHRLQADLGMSYKINKYFKVGGGYALIEKKNSSGVWKMRHRVWGDATFSLGSGDWRFSLKERLQLTHKSVNALKKQSTPNSLALKSRAKVAYKGLGIWEPYAYVELRNVFNDPSCSAVWDDASETFDDYTFTGYNDAYFNRYRGCIGTEISLARHHSLDVFLMTQYCREKETDTAGSGTILKSITYERGLYTSIGVAYKFSF